MVIESRTIVGAAGAFALVGAVLWGGAVLLQPPPQEPGSVEIQQINERAWAVEVKDLGAPDSGDALAAAR